MELSFKVVGYLKCKEINIQFLPPQNLKIAKKTALYLIDN